MVVRRAERGEDKNAWGNLRIGDFHVWKGVCRYETGERLRGEVLQLIFNC
jgi:hypothetical protein